MCGRFQTLLFFLLLAALLFSTGCYNTRFLKDGEILFKANKIELEAQDNIEKQRRFEKEIGSISQLQPNKKLFGLFKTRLWFHNIASRRKMNKFRYWMKDKVGEPPVIYDSLQAEKSIMLMTNFLKNKGFFHATVDFTADIKRKKATVIYHIEAGPRYFLRSVTFPSDTTAVSRIVATHKDKSFLKPGDPFDVANMKSERDRITDLLRNRGYYLFNREYIYFDIDSANSTRQLDLFVKINKPNDTTQHKIFHMDQIYVFTNYSLEQLRMNYDYDTVSISYFHFITEEMRYRPKILVSAIHFTKDSIFRKENHLNTIEHLSELGVFKYVNVEFVPKYINGKNLLDARVYLTPAKRQQIGLEFEANNNTDYNLGTSLTLSYRNRNVFRGTELLNISVTSGFETNLERGAHFFNTVDLGFKLDLYFNKFLIPFLKRIDKNTRPKSRITLRNEFLRRIEYYTTNSSSLSFGYEWRGSLTRRHILNPVVINLVRILESTAEFEAILNRSPSLRNSFTQQLILGSEYTFIWSDQPVHKGNAFFYYIGRINTSGNLLHAGHLIGHANDEVPPPYEIFRVRYSQYFLVDSDIRNYFKTSRNTQFVSRLFGGIGVPYGNSTSLTYIKQFFSGGANSMRAWPIRGLGPGSFNLEQSEIFEESNRFFFDQTGEVKIEANAEFRFTIFRFFKAAVFVDAGNIWLLRADTTRPGANFDFSRSWKEFALGTGLGLRFDFSYFVLRFDVGVKLREPAAGKERWPISDFDMTNSAWRKNNIRFNLAIGYPF